MYVAAEAIQRQALLEKANAMIVEHKDYFDGLQANDVEQNGNVLIFRGDYFLDEQGLPTAKSTLVFNMFKFLAQELSPRYYLQK
ncbi:hypothetical protein ED28_01675 [[Pantoea] beijingensis]|uniref:DUF2498 family protein n=1 Tax=[Pantoea] beijingensis TaxID=1324864 RepID=A0A443II57_9GAMM|nr:DUF2498 family protein [[Pantoea] beijingensis]RWR03722.1 hypothetical protein ED28_01675 [[Pantoea] beijingensis]